MSQILKYYLILSKSSKHISIDAKCVEKKDLFAKYAITLLLRYLFLISKIAFFVMDAKHSTIKTAMKLMDVPIAKLVNKMKRMKKIDI